MPKLRTFYLNSNLHAELPASWGNRHDVLPLLQSLSLYMRLKGPFPAAWSDGFRGLQTLLIAQPRPSVPPGAGSRDRQAEDVPVRKRALPPEWSSGFSALRRLDFFNLHITGTFPLAWSVSGFPLLEGL